MAYKTRAIQYFFYFALILNFKLKKKVENIMLGKLYLTNIRGLVTLVIRRTIANFEFKVSNNVATTHCQPLPTLKILSK
jgi:hypothetical protein